MATVEFAVPAGLPRDQLREVALHVQQLGYAALWVNDTASGDGLHDASVLAEVVDSVDIGIGVLPLDRWTPDQICAAVRILPTERMTMGLGSGQSSNPMAILEAGLLELRQRLPGWRLYVGALGPRVRDFAAREADGILLNWVSPGQVASFRAATSGTRAAVAAYVRVAEGPEADSILWAEREAYQKVPAYRRAFAAWQPELGAPGWLPPRSPFPTAIEYVNHLDRLILRAVAPRATVSDYRRIADAFAGLRTDLEGG